MNDDTHSGDSADPAREGARGDEISSGSDDSIDREEEDSVECSDQRSGEDEDKDAPITYSDIQNLMSDLRAIAMSLLQNEQSCLSRPSDLIQSFLIRYKVSDQDWDDVTWKNRAHFFNCAFLMMRRALIRRARGRNAQRRPPLEYRDPATLPPLIPDFHPLTPDQIIRLDEALAWLSKKDQELATIIQHHYFGGSTYEEIADMMELSRKTVQRRLALGRALLKQFMTDPDEGGDDDGGDDDDGGPIGVGGGGNRDPDDGDGAGASSNNEEGQSI